MRTVKRISRQIFRNVAAQVTRTVADAALVRPAMDSLDRARGPEDWQAAAARYRQRSAVADALHEFAIDSIDRYLNADNEKDDEA